MSSFSQRIPQLKLLGYSDHDICVFEQYSSQVKRILGGDPFYVNGNMIYLTDEERIILLNGFLISN